MKGRPTKAAATSRAERRPDRAAFHHGTRFGLLLQLAVGPVCLFVLRTGSDHGVLRGMAAVAGVALVDALYIALAGLGVTRWAESGRTRRALQYGGAAIIALFGLDVIASACGLRLIPSLALGGLAESHSSTVLGAVVLTGSNPLTIVFWAGVFSAKIAAERYGRWELWLFSLGCLSATALFLTLTAVGGALVGQLASAEALQWLNAAVGCALLCCAARLALQRAPGQRGSGHGRMEPEG